MNENTKQQKPTFEVREALLCGSILRNPFNCRISLIDVIQALGVQQGTQNLQLMLSIRINNPRAAAVISLHFEEAGTTKSEMLVAPQEVVCVGVDGFAITVAALPRMEFLKPGKIIATITGPDGELFERAWPVEDRDTFYVDAGTKDAAKAEG
jgi:hypothetical protein